MKPIRSVGDLSPNLLSVLAETIHRDTELGKITDGFLAEVKAASRTAQVQSPESAIDAIRDVVALSHIVEQSSAIALVAGSITKQCRAGVEGVIARYEREYGITILAPFAAQYDESGPESYRELVREFMCALLGAEKYKDLVNVDDLGIAAAKSLDSDPQFEWRIEDRANFTRTLVRHLVDKSVMYCWA